MLVLLMLGPEDLQAPDSLVEGVVERLVEWVFDFSLFAELSHVHKLQRILLKASN